MFTFHKVFKSTGRSSSGGEALLRMVLLVCIFVGVGWLYTRHFDSTIEELESRSAVYDQTETLTSEQKKVFRQFAGHFKDEFGLELRLVASRGRIETPALDSKTMFFGVNPDKRHVVMELPPLVEKALGEEFIQGPLMERFQRGFDEGNWPKAMAEALKMVWEQLLGVDSAGA